jgi:hypothetical protein
MDIQNVDALNVAVYKDGVAWFDFVSLLSRIEALERKAR